MDTLKSWVDFVAEFFVCFYASEKLVVGERCAAVLEVVDGAEISVPRGGGDLTVAGTPVTYDDYLAVLSTRD